MFIVRHKRSLQTLTSTALATLVLASCGGSGDSTDQSNAAMPSMQQSMATAVTSNPATLTPAFAAATTVSTTSWVRCAPEGSICNFPGTKQVRFGANGKYDYKTATGTIQCSDNGFTDPLPGIKKACDYAVITTAPAPTPAPAPAPAPAAVPAPAPAMTWTRCASEGSICTFAGTKQVRFGANGTFAYKAATGSIQCSDNGFPDPLPGVRKACDVSNTSTSTPTPAPTPTPTPTPAPAPAPAPATGAMTPYGQSAANYTLSFSEEFNSFNTSRWNDKIWYETGNATKNYTVENGALKIWPQRDASGKFFNRTIDTDGKYYQTYGYFEIEAKLPIGKGTWPAFWLFNHIGNRRPEIDVMEAYAGGGPSSGWSDSRLHPTAYAPTVWKDQSVLAGSKTIQTPDLSAGFHKYALKWEPNKQTFYFDGKEVYSLNVSMGDPMYIMLDLWYGSASGQADNSTPQGKSNSYEVNYVRAWKFK